MLRPRGPRQLAAVVAVAENGVIGRDNDLPWRLPADLRHFKQLTLGHSVIMGRKTYESIAARLGGPLPERRSIVLTRDLAWGQHALDRPDAAVGDAPEHHGVVVAHSWDEAMREVEAEDRAFVIGGAAVYREALGQCDVLHVTLVHATPEGDAHFPEIDPRVWRLADEDRRPADERNDHDVTFQTWRRR